MDSEQLWSEKGADRVLYEVFLQKSDEWIYEQEHRVVLRLEQSDRVIIPDIESIGDGRIKNKIEVASYSTRNPENGSYVINLFEVSDEAERTVLARGLAKLSRNPQVIYQMKLSSSAINNCLIGLNSNITKTEVQGRHACSTGALNIWKAKKNIDYYSIEFEQI